MRFIRRTSIATAIALSLTGCAATQTDDAAQTKPEFYGTTEPFTAEAVYFVMTDRFVDGDPNNNYEEQGATTLPGSFG